jgi:hypothetical protein
MGVTVVNAIGQVVFHQKIKGQSVFEMDVNTWVQGIYFIKTDDNSVCVKFVKN